MLSPKVGDVATNVKYFEKYFLIFFWKKSAGE